MTRGDQAKIFTHPAAARERFRGLVSQPSGNHLSEAALLIALEQYPSIDVAAYLEQIDIWSQAVRDQLDGSKDIDRILTALNHVLFEEEGFHGEADDYYDPRFSFLNEVIDRHSGLPIALSIVYLEISRRVGLQTVGVAIPGHFLVCLRGPWGEIFVDPFDEGRVLSRHECQQFLDRLYGGAVKLREQHLRSFSDNEILARLLSHLKSMYLARRDIAGAISALDRTMILGEGDVWDLRDRGMLGMRLHRYEQAIADLESYLDAAPDAQDGDRIRSEIRYLREWLSLN